MPEVLLTCPIPNTTYTQARADLQSTRTARPGKADRRLHSKKRPNSTCRPPPTLRMARHGSMLSLLLLSLVAQCHGELFYGQEAEEYPGYGFQNEEVMQEVPEEVQQNMVEEAPEDFVHEKFGQVNGIGLNSQNQMVVFHRGDREWNQYSFSNKNVFNTSLSPIKNNTITVVDPSTGNVVAEHNADLFYMPHGLTVDHDDNVWVTDVGSHQVFKLNKDFKPILTLGEKLVPGDDNTHFCKPTDVAVAKSGEFFVADGYCNSRVMKFDKDGKFIGSFGHANTGISPKAGEFFVPHSLVLIEDMNMICVADRENRRIQCFTAGLVPKGAHQRAVIPTGTFVTKAENVGRIMALREKNHYLVGVTNTEPELSNDHDLFIMDINSGKANTIASGIEDAHALAVSDAGQIFVGQLGPREVSEFELPTEPSFEQ
ncbi:unnamed protein product [Bursaphelenchus okinawaensis]|uniref:peptidylamidoglycolate lyase n=1 Tax=Bursaphelenchus okinawaensis TaxID=465554 RepID=A0A811JWH1_9BILA|nr:unnamed protein product [Bursaphelenchus okinawaensis]CAG9086304.1 unnamed protein product [Bursaphelenchus okinawaensis]